MNILLINSIGRTKWGGGEKWMLLAAAGLKSRGHHVVVACRKNSVIALKSKAAGLHTIHLPIYTDFSVTGAWKLWRQGLKERFNVIIGCQNRDVRIAGFVSPFMGHPVVLSRQGVQLIHRSYKYKWSFQHFCDGIITNTRTIKDEYDSYGWWGDDFVKVIHNGVEPPVPVDEPIDIHQWIPRTEVTPRIVLSGGRLSKQKGYEYLIEAARDVCRVHSDVYFFIAGKGKEEGRLNQLIDALGLSGRVFLVGFHENLAPLFRQSSLFVLSSLFEGMPNVVMEAMMNRVPVVSTRVNGVEELIGVDGAGVIVPPADSRALAAAIVDVLSLDSCQPMIDKAKLRVDAMFSVDAMVTNLENYLREKVSARVPRRCLVIQTAFIGDVILATPVVEKLHRFYPDCKIDFLLRKGNEGLLDHHPLLNEVIVFDKKGGKYRQLFHLIRRIRRTRYDVVVNIQRYSTTGIITALSGARQTIGFKKNGLSRFFTFRIDHRMHSSGPSEHEVVRNLKLIDHLTDPGFEMPRMYPQPSDFEAVKHDAPYYVMAATSVWFTKQYPFHKWVELMDALPYTHTIFLTGGKGDAAVCEELKKQSRHPNVVNRAGELSFLRSAALMKGAQMNFVNDSAPLHICSAMNAPVRAMFCSTVPAFGYTPLSDDAMVLETHHSLACRPCGLHGKRACPQGHFKCGDIGIDAILNALPMETGR
ncbi:MAG: glycosyltransferase [Marinilabiliaceae bacterium]|nr:glycosyltransferase [Marinilabiliaceae bacterium]